MAKLIGAFASSHAFAVEDVSGWDVKRQRNRENYAKRFGDLPDEHPKTLAETDDDLRSRQSKLLEAYEAIRARVAGARPDAIVCVGDDQDEVYTDGNFPQIAVYVGGDFEARGIDRTKPHALRSHPELGTAVYTTLVENDVDAASLATLPGDALPAHAFGPVLQMFEPSGSVPVAPVFVNAIHQPAPSPARCYRVGQLIRRAVDELPGDARVLICASGGLSHYPASYPEGHFDGGAFPWGHIDEEFDRFVVESLQQGNGRALREKTSDDLIEAGELELRSWITVAGALGTAKPEVIVYEPLYRGITGMGVAYWDLA